MARIAQKPGLRFDFAYGDGADGRANDGCRHGQAHRSMRPSLVILCVYECAVDAASGASDRAGRAWRRARDLARCGYDVWIVTGSGNRNDLERARARSGLPNLRLIHWDLPGGLVCLCRWRWARGLYRALWYRRVEHAIRDWHVALGMHTLRRVVHRSHSSITYFVLPRALSRSVMSPR